MINYRLFFYVFVFIFFLHNSEAILDIEIDIKDSFVINEDIIFSYSISSYEGEITFVSYIDCEFAPIPILFEETIYLEEGSTHNGVFYDKAVDDSMRSQTCTAYLKISDPIPKAEEKNFEIIANPSFYFDLNLDKTVFLKEENIELDYDSELSIIEIEAVLIFPNKEIKQIDLPYSFNPTQIGTYELELAASKDGYKTESLSRQFSVIERDPKIKTVDFSSRNDKIDIDYNLNLIYWILGILIVIIIFFIFKNKDKFKRKPISNTEKQLKNFIEKAENQGQSKEQLKQGLIKSGWPRRLIDKYL